MRGVPQPDAVHLLRKSVDSIGHLQQRAAASVTFTLLVAGRLVEGPSACSLLDADPAPDISGSRAVEINRLPGGRRN